MGQYRVRVKHFDTRPSHWDCSGDMDHLMGTELTVFPSVFGGGQFNDTATRWTWYRDDFDFLDGEPPKEEEAREDLCTAILPTARSMLASSFFDIAMRSGIMTDVRSREQKLEKPKKPAVTWDDVIGLEDAKDKLKEAIEAPILHKEAYKAFNITPPKGVLLYGPPGCGKTMLGKAAATAMAQVHKKDVFDGFFYFNGAEMFGPTVGYEEKWVREAFEQADNFYRQNGIPGILFFDEADSMLPRRENSPPWTKNAVNQFLSLMDGLKECTAFVILATNDHLCLDKAAIRSGRIDRKIYVGPPGKGAVKKIMESCFSKKPMQEPLVDLAVSEIYNESRFIGERYFSEHINGANAAAIPELAASIAFNRAIKNKLEAKDMFITKEDTVQAINILFAEIVEFSKTVIDRSPKMEFSVNHKIQVDGKDQDFAM